MYWWIWLGTLLLIGVGFFVFNYWQGTSVMYRVAAKSYFRARQQGLTHKRSVQWMVESRYKALDVRKKVMGLIHTGEESLADLPTMEGDGDQLAWAIFVMFCTEHGVHPPNSSDVMVKIENEIRRAAGELHFDETHFWPQ